MAVISVEVPESIAKKFAPYEVVKLSDLSMEEQLLAIDGEGWENIVDFGPEGLEAKEFLSYLKSHNG